jgi:hypothetical protein
MAFHVILVAPGLNDQDRARAASAGPPHATAAPSYPELLASAGFEEIDEVDLTDQYRVTAAAWLHESADAAAQLEEIFGIEEFRRGQQEREETLSAIERGLLKRSLFAARPRVSHRAVVRAD